MRVPRIPSARTLKRYGLTLEEWADILYRQGGSCGVCHTVPPSGILHIDHEHVRLWKRMASDKRKQYVRGLACFRCNNTWLRKGATPTKLRAAADYLEAYERITKE